MEKFDIGGRLMTQEQAIELLWRYKRALEGLTPGGSEFVNDPETCADHIRKRQAWQHANIMRLVKKVKAHRG